LVGLAGMVIKDLAADFLHLTIFWYGISIYSSLVQKNPPDCAVLKTQRQSNGDSVMGICLFLLTINGHINFKSDRCKKKTRLIYGQINVRLPDGRSLKKKYSCELCHYTMHARHTSRSHYNRIPHPLVHFFLPARKKIQNIKFLLLNT
jgi:hypothetical protein